MGGRNLSQRLLATKQPYTILVSKNGGETYEVKGYTWDSTVLEGEEQKWEEHDLGSDYSLDAAKEVAEEWKQALVGIYFIA